MKAMIKETKRNCGIAAAALLMALAMAGCLNPIAPPAAKAAAPDAASGAGQRKPYTAAVYLGEDGDARSVAGPTAERISLTGIRNYIQVVAVDKADGTVAGFAEARKTGPSLMSPPLTLRGLTYGHTYAILFLQGHWERDYAAETAGGAYAYTNNPPTLLNAGYVDVPFTRDSSSVTINVWPIYVDTVFTAAGLSAEPAVTAGKPGAASLAAAAEWAANWKVLRGETGAFSGLGDLVNAQKAAGFPGESFIVTGKKAVVWPGTDALYAPGALTLAGNTVTLPLNADSTSLSRIGKTGAVNFALSFVPFNVTEGWAKYDASSVFDLAAGPPEWVIRNGLNDAAQDDKTDFEKFGTVPVTEANGNGAVRFTVADPLRAAARELVVSDSYFTEPTVIFTTSGYTGRAQVWYAAVPSGGSAPAYAAYIPLGDAAPGTHIKQVTLPVPGTAYDIYLVLLKDGKAGAVHQIGVEPEPEPEPPLPGTLTSVAAARYYLASLAAAGDSRGGSAGDPVLLPMAMHLDGEDSVAKLLSLIAETGKYAALDLSRCTMNGTQFDTPRDAAGKNRVVSLTLPDAADSIYPDALPAFTSLKYAAGRNIKDIPDQAFWGCTALTTVDFPAAVSIGRMVFYRITGLSTVNLPAVTSIPADTFTYSTALSTVNLSSVTSIPDEVFAGRTALIAVDISSVRDIGARAFSGCTALAAVKLPPLDTTFPPRLTRVGERVFSGCTALTAIDLPASVISNGLFEGCTSLTKADLSLAIRMGEDVFRETGAGYLTVTLGARAPIIDQPISASVRYAKTVTVKRPANSSDYQSTWQKTFKWSFGGNADITLIGDPPFPSLLSFSVADVRAYLDYLAANGDLLGSSAGNSVFLPVQMHLSGADSLENLLAAIGEKGKYVDLDLSQCSMSGTEFDPRGAGTGKNLVVSLSLPDAARSIPNGSDGNQVFKDFSSLKTAGGSAVISIGGWAFYDCRALTRVNFPAAGTIGEGAFRECSALTIVNLPAAVNFGQNAFQDCTSLTSMNLPAAVNIGESAFKGCTALTTVNSPAAVNIDQFCFEGCTALATVNLPAVEYINRAFLNTGPETLTITLGRYPPVLDGDSPNYPSYSYAKTVIIKRPAANRSDYDNVGWWYVVFPWFLFGHAKITLVIQDL